MNGRVAALAVALVVAMASGAAHSQKPPQVPATPEATRPPADNDQTLRALSPDEIAPNLSFYAIDPLYKPGIPLGWSSTPVVEKLGRGLTVTALDGGRAYLSWRLLQSDPEDAAFNVYRAAANGAGVKINSQVVRRTTDYV